VVHDALAVAGDYFAAMGIPLREGRYLNHADTRSEQMPCVVDEDFARRYWPQGGAIGKQVYMGTQIKPGDEPFVVVGVVGAVKQSSLTDTQAKGAIYLPYNRWFARDYYLVARTELEPQAIAGTLSKVIRQIDPELPLNDIRSMDVRIEDTLITRRSPALLAGVFALAALLLAAIGTYGVLSYAVAQRRREIGVRMALGAQRRQIANQFLSLGLRLLALGACVGVLGAWLAGKAMQTVLFNVPALHLATLTATALVMTVVSVLACWLPARRAAKVEPMVALRHE
jgi:ABC-type antimicrobial peptide transport system permease subunit